MGDFLDDSGPYALRAGFVDLPALGQLVLGDASSVHVGVLPQVLSGLYERAVCHGSQAIRRELPSCCSSKRFTCCVCCTWCAILCEITTAVTWQTRQEKDMRTIDRVREVAPPPLNARDKEMVRVAQRCIMASLDHSRAAAITLTTDTGGRCCPTSQSG